MGLGRAGSATDSTSWGRWERGKRPDPSALPSNPGRGRRHPGIGPLGSRDESMRGSELVVDAKRGRAISSSGRANQACRRVVEVLQEEGPDLDLILDL